MMLTKIRKCTDARSAAKSGGFAELPTERRERNKASTGKNARYAITQKVAARGESSAERPCHQRKPLYSAISGAAKLVMTSSSPVLTSVTVDVRMSSESEVRKKRSAGKATSLGAGIEAAMADFLIVASAGRGRNEVGPKDYSHRSPAAGTAAARAARATFLVKLETGRLEIPFNGTCLAPRKSGRFFVSIMK